MLKPVIVMGMSRPRYLAHRCLARDRVRHGHHRPPYTTHIRPNTDTWHDHTDALQRKLFPHTPFRNPSLLHHALNPSPPYNHLDSTGDAILEYHILAHITARCPELSRGCVAHLRSTLVCNAMLAKVADAWGLSPLVQRTGCQLDDAAYQVVYAKASTVEALIGALYLDQVG